MGGDDSHKNIAKFNPNWFQKMNALHSHANHSTVLTFCEEIRRLQVECILYTLSEKAIPSSVTWKLMVEAGP